jgi:hypothetical protein
LTTFAKHLSQKEISNSLITQLSSYKKLTIEAERFFAYLTADGTTEIKARKYIPHRKEKKKWKLSAER